MFSVLVVRRDKFQRRRWQQRTTAPVEWRWQQQHPRQLGRMPTRCLLPGVVALLGVSEQRCDNVSCASCAKLLHVQIERRFVGSIRKVSHRIPRPSASRASRPASVVHFLQSYNDSSTYENTFNKAWLTYFPLGVQSSETISSNWKAKNFPFTLFA